ncbi:MAG TPA: hypothetical protein VFT22_26210, partial [Kofleriaceae bacterium]|nr:hypothetical protein [Kofleriaceae bacterium]
RCFLLPLLIAGCAAERLVVPDSDWNTVPAPQRAAVDRQMAADLAAAQAEITAASASLAELQRAPAQTGGRAASGPASTAAVPVDSDQEWANALRSHEHARGDAFARVEAAKTAWQRADLSWRQLRLAAARERLDVLAAQRELVRAQTIDHSLPGTDHYEVAPLRGQFSQAQQRWYAVERKAQEARTALEKASASLASAKEAYAQLMRNGPVGVAMPPVAADDEHRSLQLTGWFVARTDIRRRRGLRHFLESGGAPQLRNPPAHPAALWIPTPRPGPASSPGAAAPAAASAARPAAPTSPAARPAPTSAAPASAGTSAAAASAARPAAPTSPAARPAPASAPAAAPATTANARPAAPTSAAAPEPATAPTSASSVVARPASTSAAQAGAPVGASTIVARPGSSGSATPTPSSTAPAAGPTATPPGAPAGAAAGNKPAPAAKPAVPASRGAAARPAPPSSAAAASTRPATGPAPGSTKPAPGASPAAASGKPAPAARTNGKPAPAARTNGKPAPAAPTDSTPAASARDSAPAPAGPATRPIN